jgi:hypothetical protein
VKAANNSSSVGCAGAPGGAGVSVEESAIAPQNNNVARCG